MIPNRRWGKEAVRQTTRSILHRHPPGANAHLFYLEGCL
jgi:hypothetical protein